MSLCTEALDRKLNPHDQGADRHSFSFAAVPSRNRADNPNRLPEQVVDI